MPTLSLILACDRISSEEQCSDFGSLAYQYYLQLEVKPTTEIEFRYMFYRDHNFNQ